MASDLPQIRVSEDARDYLHSEKQPGDSYADVLDRVLEDAYGDEWRGGEE